MFTILVCAVLTLTSAMEVDGEGAPAAEPTMVTLMSSQGVPVELPVADLMVFGNDPAVCNKDTCQSALIGTMIDDNGTDEEIPLLNVKTSILNMVVDFMKHHSKVASQEIQKPLKSTVLKECGVSDWDADFFDIEQDVIFELILAANYLDIKALLDVSCAKVASMIKGKTPEEIRKQFNIVNDFTPEEETQVREEQKWVEDQ